MGILLVLAPAIACAARPDQAATRSGQGGPRPPPWMSQESPARTQDSELVPQGVESHSIDEGNAAEEARPTPPVALAPRPLARCGLGPATSMQVRVRVGDGSTTIDLGPGATVDDRARRCIHEALEPIDVDGQLSRGSPSDRPSGFTALFQLEW